MSAPIPTILFGAFDRHNFGDLLFPHIAGALLEPEYPVFAGLVERDLRSCSGHQVEALAELAVRWRDHPVNILHAGGELLTCDAWQAAVMTLPPEEALDIILRFDGRPGEALEWAQRRTGMASIAPYTVRRSLFPRARAVAYNAVGGVDLDGWDQAYRDEVLANLRAADAVGVRDTATQAHLHAAGIATALMPDPAVMVAELFGDEIRRRSEEGEILRMRQVFPQGYIAVQFSADFGDDATLFTIAGQLDALVSATGLAIALFRAGAAPWHDDIVCYERVAARMRSPAVRLFTSLDLWDICALISASRGYLGSSLHGRIVAMAFALPRVNVVRTKDGSKQAAFASTWEDVFMPHAVQMEVIAQGMQQALAVDASSLRRKARQLADGYRHAFQAMCDGFFSLGKS